eukprot:GSChrysophyteH1.ASY1.ANO1.2519.1 assembled CDS
MEFRSENNTALALYYAIMECNDAYIADKLKESMFTLFEALRIYGPDQLFASFNGGKDAVVIMHLLGAAMAKYNQDSDNKVNSRPKLIYFSIENEFPEVLDYIQQAERTHGFELITYDGGIAKGLTKHISTMAADSLFNPAFILGTRKADPNSGGQKAFTPSSSWIEVSFMRVNPILDWDYGHVWHFLRSFKLAYCPLYEQGYTSLGNQLDTHVNPALSRLVARKGWPAYLLSDWSCERSGRVQAGEEHTLPRTLPNCAYTTCPLELLLNATNTGSHILRLILDAPIPDIPDFSLEQKYPSVRSATCAYPLDAERKSLFTIEFTVMTEVEPVLSYVLNQASDLIIRTEPHHAEA